MDKLNKIGPNIDHLGITLTIPRYELNVEPIFTR